MEKSRLFFKLKDRRSSGGFYAFVSGEQLENQGAPARVAWQIERLAAQRGWPVGELIGSESELREYFDVCRETLREAISILESRGVVEVRRGRAGGVKMLSSNTDRTASAMVAYLRAIGITQGQIARSVTGLDRLLAYQLCRDPGPLLPRRPDEPLRRWLARACGHPVYMLYVAVLDAFATPASEQDITPQGVEAALARGDVEALIGLLGGVPNAPSVKSGIADQPWVPARAFVIANALIEQTNKGGPSDLGNEEALCEEFAASRSVIRQALRILQDLDVVHARLGRGGGYDLKRPSPIGIIRQVFAWFSAWHASPFELVDLLWDFNAVNLRVAAAQLAEMNAGDHAHHLDRLERVFEQKKHAQRFVNLQQCLAEIADCPVVDTMARCIISYQARCHQQEFEVRSAEQSFLRLEQALMAALRAGDPDRAEAMLRALQDRLRELIQSDLAANDSAPLAQH